MRDSDASKARVFELRIGNFRAVTERLGAWPKYDFTHGVGTGAPRRPKLVPECRTIARDRVFGRRNVARCLDGAVHKLRLGTGDSLAKQKALDFSAEHPLTGADGDSRWNVWNV